MALSKTSWIPVLHLLGRADGIQIVAVVSLAVEFDADAPSYAEPRTFQRSNPSHLGQQCACGLVVGGHRVSEQELKRLGFTSLPKSLTGHVSKCFGLCGLSGPASFPASAPAPSASVHLRGVLSIAGVFFIMFPACITPFVHHRGVLSIAGVFFIMFAPRFTPAVHLGGVLSVTGVFFIVLAPRFTPAVHRRIGTTVRGRRFRGTVAIAFGNFRRIAAATGEKQEEEQQ